MSNVVNLKRSHESLKETAIDAIKNSENTLQFFISFPEEDNGQIFVYSNFTPGVREVYALEKLMDYLMEQEFTINDEDL